MLDYVYKEIDRIYDILSKKERFTIRPSQVELSKLLAKAYTSNGTLVAEAPTGTGKSMCYLIAMLACRKMGAVTEPFIVATATKLLQQQLFEKDIPTLVRVGVASLSDFALAKGKNNYICLNSADQFISLAEDSSGLAYIAQELEEVGVNTILDMVEAYEKDEWNGDFENYRPYRLGNQSQLRVRSETCLRTSCPRYEVCAYYRSTQDWSTAKIIISNIDLLLMHHLTDNSLFSMAKYHLMVDEGHHLPDKAIEQASKSIAFHHLEEATKRLVGLRRAINLNKHARVTLQENIKFTEYQDVLFDVSSTLTSIQVAYSAVQAHLTVKHKDSDKNSELAINDRVPMSVTAHFATLNDLLMKCLSSLDAGVDTVTELVKRHNNDRVLMELQQRFQEIVRPYRAAVETFRLWPMRDQPDYACWLTWDPSFAEISVHCTSVAPGKILQALMWRYRKDTDSTPAHIGGVAVISATMRDLNGYTRILQRLGLDVRTPTHTVPHTFPYQESRIVVPKFKVTPKPAERAQYIPAVQNYLLKVVKPSEGTLILCTSWSMLKELHTRLLPKLGDKLKIQGTMSVKHLLEAHKADIDRGVGSILMGVASLSEGLDLPGKYCEHVIINAIPFAVPDSPVEEKLQLVLGKDYFNLRSLPDASVKLSQMVGRLIRRESDRGRVTILDVRLTTTSYGTKLVRALPPFRLEQSEP